MKYNYLLLFLVCGFTSCKHMVPVHLRGTVYEIGQGDTIPIPGVTVNFYITEKYGSSIGHDGWLSYDSDYILKSDSLGNFDFIFKVPPYSSVYELTFRKEGFVFESYKSEFEDFDYNRPFIYNQKLIRGELIDYYYQRHQKIEEDQKMVPIITIVTAVIFIILVFFYYRFGTQIFDWWRRKRSVSFQNLDPIQQSKILEKAWCNNCGSCSVNNPKEIRVGIIPHVTGYCKKCGSEVIIRIG